MKKKNFFFRRIYCQKKLLFFRVFSSVEGIVTKTNICWFVLILVKFSICLQIWSLLRIIYVFFKSWEVDKLIKILISLCKKVHQQPIIMKNGCNFSIYFRCASENLKHNAYLAHYPHMPLTNLLLSLRKKMFFFTKTTVNYSYFLWEKKTFFFWKQKQWEVRKMMSVFNKKTFENCFLKKIFFSNIFLCFWHYKKSIFYYAEPEIW